MAATASRWSGFGRHEQVVVLTGEHKGRVGVIAVTGYYLKVKFSREPGDHAWLHPTALRRFKQEEH